MDVVAPGGRPLKGTIDLQTEPGRGTRLTVRLPARLALETAMIVRVDGQAFALPVAQIESTPSRSSRPEVTHRRDRSRPRPFRDRQIPLVAAREMLGLSAAPAPAWPKLLVVRSANGLVGLAVDAIEGTEELVIKPLGACWRVTR